MLYVVCTPRVSLLISSVIRIEQYSYIRIISSNITRTTPGSGGQQAADNTGPHSVTIVTTVTIVTVTIVTVTIVTVTIVTVVM